MDDLFDPSICFFCKLRSASRLSEHEVYKAIQHKEVFARYAIKLATTKIQIPICSECAERNRKVHKYKGVMAAGCYIASVGLIFAYLAGEGELVYTLVISLFLGLPLSSILYLVVAGLWWIVSSPFLGSQGYRYTEEDYPVYKRLIELGWDGTPPKPKYSPKVNELMSEQEVGEVYKKTVLEALIVKESYEAALRQRFSGLR